MDPVLAEIYRTVLDAAPYVLAAYGLLWIGMFAYVFMVLRRLSRVEKEVAVLEDTIKRRSGV